MDSADQRMQNILNLQAQLKDFDISNSNSDPTNAALLRALKANASTGDVTPVMPSRQFTDADFKRLMQLRNNQPGQVTNQANIDEENNLVNLLNSSQPPSNNWHQGISSTTPDLDYSKILQIADASERNRKMSMIPDYGQSDEELRGQYNLPAAPMSSTSLPINPVGSPASSQPDQSAPQSTYSIVPKNPMSVVNSVLGAQSSAVPSNYKNVVNSVLNAPRPVPVAPAPSKSAPAAPIAQPSMQNKTPDQAPGFFSKLFNGGNYQSNNQLVAPKGSTDATDINWGSGDNSADFFRASQALNKMDPNYVANNADDTFAQGGTVDENHPVVQRAMALVRHFLLNG
jgi:hypothetical protein